MRQFAPGPDNKAISNVSSNERPSMKLIPSALRHLQQPFRSAQPVDSASTTLSACKALIFVAVVCMGFVGCAGEDDIDRTQPNRLPKSMFDGTWYIRTTVTDVPGTAGASFVGLNGTMEKIYWNIQENNLYACRAYEEIPGVKRNRNEVIARGCEENPIAVYPITSHFDIKRNYNAATGEQTNVIAENINDRPWYERDYIRVDWTNSSLDPISFSSMAGGGRPSTSYFVQGHETHPDAIRFETKDRKRINFDALETVANTAADDWGGKIDYFDMVGNYQLEPETVTFNFGGSSMDIPLCFFVGQQTRSCGPSEVSVRTAFLRVGDRNFEPVPLPDREMAKFGYFRTERFTWDERYGFTESGRIYLANVFNIWEAAYQTDEEGNRLVDANGLFQPIPVADRVPKAIEYHLNRNYPCEMVQAAQDATLSWNASFPAGGCRGERRRDRNDR